MADRIRLTTPECRLSYPALFEPRKPGDMQAGKFTATLLFPKENDAAIKLLRDAVKTIVADKWGQKVPKTLHLPILDGDDEEQESYHGNWFVRVWTKIKPAVYFIGEHGAYEKATEPRMFYPGCWVRASVTPFAWVNMGKQGVTFGLNSVLFVRDDDPFVSYGDPVEDFGAPPVVNGGEVGELTDVPF